MPKREGVEAPASIRLIRSAAGLADLADWGPIEPSGATGGSGAAGAPGAGEAGRASRTRGALLHRGQEKHPEAGVWECTPGRWDCKVTRPEFCHFLSGRSVYTHESGERIVVGAGDTAWFPAGWAGTCEVLETVRKVYVIL